MFKKYFIFCLFIFVYSLSGQNNNKYKDLDWHIFHSLNWKDYIDFKSEEWKSMSIEEKKSLFQIPIEELQKMTTDELIEASVDCFFSRRIGKFSNMDSYYKEIYNSFNGFRELIKRKDIGRKIIDYYRNLDPTIRTLSKSGLKMKKQIQILEFLIVYPEILVQLKQDELGKLFLYLREKYSRKIKMASIYSEKDVVPNVYALARVLERKDLQVRNKLYSVDQINIFLGSGIILTGKTRDQILKICNEL